MRRVLTDIADEAVIAAHEESCIQFWLHYGRGPGCEVHEDGDLEWFTTGIPFALLNGVMRARLTPETADARIEELAQEFRRRELPLEWNVGPSSWPEDLGRHLEAHGMPLTFSIPGMVIDLRELPDDPPRPKGLTIARATSRGEREAYVRVGASAFGVPEPYVPRLIEIEAGMGEEHRELAMDYLGLLDGRPVATTMLLLTAGIAGIYFVGTVPDARGRGIAEAMTRTALLDARDRGYRIGILQASSMGYPVYRRIGFRDHVRFDIYGTPRK